MTNQQEHVSIYLPKYEVNIKIFSIWIFFSSFKTTTIQFVTPTADVSVDIGAIQNYIREVEWNFSLLYY